MNQVINRVTDIIEESRKLLENKDLEISNPKLDYVAIFAKDVTDFDNLNEEIQSIGELVNENQTGLTYILNSALRTEYGEIKLVKIRRFDEAKTQLGAPDFRIENYQELKNKYLEIGVLKLVTSSDGFELLELSDSKFNALVYFPQKPISEEHFLANPENVSSNNSSVNKDISNLLEEEKSRRLMLMAEFDNYKKRVESERALFGAMANMGIIREVLEIYDDLGLAINDEALNLESSKTSIKSARDKISNTVKNAGVEPIEISVGEDFDKEKMEAIQAIPDDQSKNKVIAVISSAYKFSNRDGILKPAKVIVGK